MRQRDLVDLVIRFTDAFKAPLPRLEDGR